MFIYVDIDRMHTGHGHNTATLQLLTLIACMQGMAITLRHCNSNPNRMRAGHG